MQEFSISGSAPGVSTRPNVARICVSPVEPKIPFFGSSRLKLTNIAQFQSI
jgi:hypothetical protein